MPLYAWTGIMTALLSGSKPLGVLIAGVFFRLCRLEASAWNATPIFLVNYHACFRPSLSCWWQREAVFSLLPTQKKAETGAVKVAFAVRKIMWFRSVGKNELCRS